MKIFALLDKKLNVFMPFFCPDVFEAKRSLFIEMNNGADCPLNNAPNDFSLWLLGEVLEDGTVNTVVSPLFIEECFNFVKNDIDMHPASVKSFDDVDELPF